MGDGISMSADGGSLPGLGRPQAVKVDMRVAASVGDGYPGTLLASVTVTVAPDQMRPEWEHYHGPVGDQGRRAGLEAELRKVIDDWLDVRADG